MMEEQADTTLPDTNQGRSYAIPDEEKFLIAGIGASAGGVQALMEFFEHVEPDSNVAYVVILHLSPDHDSELAKILQAIVSIPVIQVTEKVHVQKNHVYVI